MNENNEHIPVLLNEILGVVADSRSFFVDVTLGRGGHFLKAVELCDKCLGVDRDNESIKFVEKKLLDTGFIRKGNFWVNGKKQICIVSGNFTNIQDYIETSFAQTPGVILADLGVSTYQIKSSVQGLSFERPDDLLDMRLDKSVNVTAADLLNALSKDELTKLFSSLAEVSNSKTLAKRIVDYRATKKIETVQDFMVAGGFKKRPGKTHTATKPFMALRIAVNSEHINLKDFLTNCLVYIKRGSKLLIITFHSLEEKKVYQFIKINNLKVTKIKPSKKEVGSNKSSRSANLLIIENE